MAPDDPQQQSFSSPGANLEPDAAGLSELNPMGLDARTDDSVASVELPQMALVSSTTAVAEGPQLPEMPPMEKVVSMESARPRSEDQLEKARKRQEVYLQKRREKKKRRVFYNRICGLIRLFAGMLMLAGLYLLLSSPYFQFSHQNMTLAGAKLITRADILRFIEPLDQKAIYKINPQVLERQMKQELPLLDQIHIRRHLFPVGLEIVVSEKPSWGIVYTTPPVEEPSKTDVTVPASEAKADSPVNPDQTLEKAPSVKVTPPKPTYLVHWDSSWTDLAAFKLTPQVEKSFDSAIPLVLKRAQLTQLNSQAWTRYREIAQFLNSRPGLTKLQYLDLTNPYDIYAEFDGFKVRVGRADSLVMDRLERLFPLIPAIRERQDQLQFVDLRWNKQILFKQKAPVHEDPPKVDG